MHVFYVLNDIAIVHKTGLTELGNVTLFEKRESQQRSYVTLACPVLVLSLEFPKLSPKSNR